MIMSLGYILALVVLAPRNIIAVVTRCWDQGCHLKFGATYNDYNDTERDFNDTEHDFNDTENDFNDTIMISMTLIWNSMTLPIIFNDINTDHSNDTEKLAMMM